MPSPRPPVPRLASLGGALIFLAAFLPLHPEGASFFDMLLLEFSRGLLQGVLMLAGLGSPFLFGLALLAAVPLLSPATARRVVRVPIALMHSQLVLVAIVLVSAGDAVAPLGLLGFAAVSGVYLALHSARTHAEGDGPSVAWYVRWGAIVVAAIAAWAELQRVGDVVLGIGLHVLLAGALLTIVVMGRKSLAAPAPLEPEPEPTPEPA